MPVPLDMNGVVKAIKRRYGRVELVPGGGLTLVVVNGLRLAFPEAEKLALGKVTLEELQRAAAGR